MPTGSFQQFVIGFSLFLVAILTGIIMSWVGGQLIDGFYANSLNGVPLVPSDLVTYAQSPLYNGMQLPGEMLYFVNLFYLLCYVLPILGAALFYQSLVKYQSAEFYGPAIGGSSDGGEGRRRRRRRR